MALGIALHAGDQRTIRTRTWRRPSGCRPPGRRRRCGAEPLAHTYLARDDLAAVRAPGAEAIELASQERHAEYPHAAGAHAGLAQARSRRGDHAAAREDADRAVDLARRGHSGPETAHTLLSRAEVALAAGDRDQARRDADEARAMLDGAIGNHNLHRMLTLVEEQLGGGAATAVPAAGGDLTDRELAVLRRLTGDGSAREIAADLYVSHNTVKTQMRAIYRKLGVATREDAVARARERGLLPRSLSR